jgi:hypothetical protein
VWLIGRACRLRLALLQTLTLMRATQVLLLLESASRLHTTRFARDKSATPSNFTMKLRKHLRGRRLESIAQVGMDRVCAHPLTPLAPSPSPCGSHPHPPL